MSDIRILGVDPGPTRSALVLLDGDRVYHAYEDNANARSVIRYPHMSFTGLMSGRMLLAIEGVSCYGQAVGQDVFDTAIWIGRFIEQAEADAMNPIPVVVNRTRVRTYLCDTSRCGDSEVRQALMDRWGGEIRATRGEKCPACNGRGSTKRVPCEECGASGWAVPRGQLYGIARHCWSALAVAVYTRAMLALGKLDEEARRWP